MTSRFKTYIQLIAAVLSIVPILSACGGAGASGGAGAGGYSRPAVSVKVSTAHSGVITESTIYTGTAKSRHSVTLTPQIDGQVTKILVEAGDTVKKGTPLIEISPEKQQASVSSYEAASNSSQQDLVSARSTLKSLESQKIEKISNLKLSQVNRERYNTLFGSGAVSKMEYDQRINAQEAAQAQVTTVDQQIAAQQAVIAKIEHQVKQSSSDLKQQRVQLQYYTMRAPFDGVVGDIPVKVGNYVNTSTQLTTVTQNNPLEVYVEVPVEHSQDIKLNTAIELLDQRDKLIGTSKVFFIAPNVSPDSQTVLVKANYDNAQGKVRSDQLLKARVVWQRRQGVTVPTEAVSHQSGEDFLFLADAGTGGGGKLMAKQIPVKLGDIEGSDYQVIDGVKPGDKVIVSGVQNLADKTPISIVQ